VIPDLASTESGAVPLQRAKPALAVADQVLVSFAHFVVGLSVARTDSAAALGLFGVAFLLINSAADLHRAVVWLPMSQESEASQYRTARRLGIVLGCAMALLGLFASAILFALEIPDWALLTAGMALTLPFFFTHEIQRRIQFALLTPARAIVADLIYAATAVAGIMWLPSVGTWAPGQAVRALAVLVLAGLAGGVAGWLLLLQLPPSKWSVTELIARYAPASRAYALNAGMVFGSQRLSMLVLAGVLGVDALANVEAARLLTAPLMVTALGLAALTVPMTSHALRTGGAAEMRAALNRGTVLAIVIAGTYGAALLAGVETMSSFAFNRVYDHSRSLGLLFCGIAATSLIATTLVVPAGLAGHARAVPRARLPGVLLVVLGAFPAAALLDEHAVLLLVFLEGLLSMSLLRRTVDRLYREGSP
jgi:hypothetical protein